MKRIVTVNDRMQRGYRNELVAPRGRYFHPDFRPQLTPAQMLALGVFCGKYMTDTRREFPASWFTRAKLSPNRRDCSLNYFGVDASQPLSVWRKKGWIHSDDPAGGSNGIAAITWAVECPRKMRGRSNVGRQFAVMLHRSSDTASQAI
jgi:hypothetical protein